MIRLLCALPFAILTSAMVAGCADDSFSGRQRPAPGYDNVNMGSSQPGQQHRSDESPPASQRDPYSRSQPGQPGYY
ncbi:MAG: hypothetical protein P0120_07740 [Nitrospira sp.]|nr:hypothetical protein [Nitrospira sp.]